MKRALQIVFAISLFGVAFSGTLSYRELFGSSLGQCPSPGATGTVLGYPACVYGFFMYSVLSIVAAWGLWSGRRERLRREPSADLRSRSSVEAHSRPLASQS